MPRKKCGCASAQCACSVVDSDSVTWEGHGSADQPYVPNVVVPINVVDTPSLDLTLTESEGEIVLSAQPSAGIDVQVFTANGVWNKPVGVNNARVLLIGGGGAGASGSSTLGSGATGGAGGDPGQVAAFVLSGTAVPASAAVTVGLGGLGGVPVSGNASGLAGTAGGSTIFGDYRAYGGNPGGAAGAAPTPHRPDGTAPTQHATSATTGSTFIAAHYAMSPGAGGNGEGSSYTPQEGGYSHPAQGARYPDDVGGGTAGGGDGRDELVTKMGGGGGGGNRWTDGGKGGLYGAGGGGGGWGSATPSGRGGDGAPGICVVISW